MSQVWSCRPIKCPIKCPVHPTGLTALVYPHRPGTSTSSIFTYKIIITSHLDSCYNNWFAEPNNFLTNGQKPSKGSSFARPFHRGLDLTAVGQFAGQMGQITDSVWCPVAEWCVDGGGYGMGNTGPCILLMA